MSPRGTFARDSTVPKQMLPACLESQENHEQPRGPRKESASTILESSAVLLKWILAPAYARCASVVITGPNMIYTLPSGELINVCYE